MLRKTILVMFVTLACVSLSNGQEFAKPGPEHAKLKDFEGNWDTLMIMGDQKTKGTATYKSICSGMWMASDFNGELAGGIKFQGHGLDGYNQTKKKYVGVWVDSLSSAPMQFEGNFDPKTKMLVMTGEGTGPDGKPEKSKNTTEWKDKDHFTFKMYMIQPDGRECVLGRVLGYAVAIVGTPCKFGMLKQYSIRNGQS